MKIKTGDTVTVRVGKDRGKSGKIVRAIPSLGKVLVENINLVNRHKKPRKQGEKGQRVSIPAFINVSNVKLVCPSCKQAVRVRSRRHDGGRERQCHKCGASL
ncbi:MAG: 50S ribosomal protein L24 [Candidatus Terrybacteria bacterium RIFCSPHIGHO2_01_FULL_48_17]|uniref:Large ribosomal subunit protein uL24 n=1 Tax=Candidatus Terrybacteria bacterium RIFCSPHIGHO2_01_FULL_48_17 TaxID=1802362 RepID=A0A1G2PMV7_9BACT|nr:MAG: 50S ribosomal protein L24 [Candidatus Terrybacteria bacterium RIFCSPHIGHO2_01_FULL_48_17]OHA52834.1 MAG: 50S ribosomal protein L24 [Candidatus Terrybacteria bacterium RIFCSPLOWO2_01_FULL_48_14]